MRRDLFPSKSRETKKKGSLKGSAKKQPISAVPLITPGATKVTAPCQDTSNAELIGKSIPVDPAASPALEHVVRLPSKMKNRPSVDLFRILDLVVLIAAYAGSELPLNSNSWKDVSWAFRLVHIWLTVNQLHSTLMFRTRSVGGEYHLWAKPILGFYSEQTFTLSAPPLRDPTNGPSHGFAATFGETTGIDLERGAGAQLPLRGGLRGTLRPSKRPMPEKPKERSMTLLAARSRTIRLFPTILHPACRTYRRTDGQLGGEVEIRGRLLHQQRLTVNNSSNEEEGTCQRDIVAHATVLLLHQNPLSSTGFTPEDSVAGTLQSSTFRLSRGHSSSSSTFSPSSEANSMSVLKCLRTDPLLFREARRASLGLVDVQQDAALLSNNLQRDSLRKCLDALAPKVSVTVFGIPQHFLNGETDCTATHSATPTTSSLVIEVPIWSSASVAEWKWILRDRVVQSLRLHEEGLQELVAVAPVTLCWGSHGFVSDLQTLSPAHLREAADGLSSSPTGSTVVAVFQLVKSSLRVEDSHVPKLPQGMALVNGSRHSRATMQGLPFHLGQGNSSNSSESHQENPSQHSLRVDSWGSLATAIARIAAVEQHRIDVDEGKLRQTDAMEEGMELSMEGWSGARRFYRYKWIEGRSRSEAGYFVCTQESSCNSPVDSAFSFQDDTGSLPSPSLALIYLGWYPCTIRVRFGIDAFTLAMRVDPQWTPELCLKGAMWRLKNKVIQCTDRTNEEEDEGDTNEAHDARNPVLSTFYSCVEQGVGMRCSFSPTEDSYLAQEHVFHHPLSRSYDRYLKEVEQMTMETFLRDRLRPISIFLRLLD